MIKLSKDKTLQITHNAGNMQVSLPIFKLQDVIQLVIVGLAVLKISWYGSNIMMVLT